MQMQRLVNKSIDLRAACGVRRAACGVRRAACGPTYALFRRKKYIVSLENLFVV